MTVPLCESGHYAVAGFLYQLIGSGVKALQVLDVEQNGESASECLILERFGQDAVVLPADNTSRKPKLIQFKYSSTRRKINPQELVENLQGFQTSVDALGCAIEQCDFELVTNRGFSRTARRYLGAKNKPLAELESLFGTLRRSQPRDVPELAAIFQRLEIVERTDAQFREAIDTAGRAFGMLESEIRVRVHEFIGLLMDAARNSNDRIVHPSEIHRALTGFTKPYKLRGEDSVNVRLDDVRRFQRHETSGIKTVPRAVSDEIARAILEHPVIVVVGEGGSGKSVAASDAILAGLQDRNSPPGFGLVVRALNATSDSVMDTVARWRNQGRHDDGSAYETSVQRLERAFSGRPLLAVCIDAIDEKDGRARLPSRTEDFIRSLIERAVASHESGVVPQLSVVLTCRRRSEFDSLLSRGFDCLHDAHEIPVTGFDDDELTVLASDLPNGVGCRITNHLPTSALQTRRGRSRSVRFVAQGALEVIRHPVFWRVFCSMNESSQHQCLDGGAGLARLAEEFIRWFRTKAEIRIPTLGSHGCEAALAAVAQGFRKFPARTGDRSVDWITPCVKSTDCSAQFAIQLMEEATTAGILDEVESGGRSWRWRHIWLCEYLARNGEAGT